MLSTLAIIIGLVVVAYFLYDYFSEEEVFEDGESEEEKVIVEVDPALMKYGPINIYFSSQSGTSEGFADTLREEAAENSVLANIVNVKNFNAEEHLKEVLSVFLISTHYEGEPPDDANDWWDWLKDSSNGQDYKHLKFAMFGLGDKTYQYFNKFSLDVAEKLTGYGASLIHNHGQGSNHLNHIEDDFEEWKIGLFNKILENAPSNPSYDPTAQPAETSGQPVCKYTSEVLSEDLDEEETPYSSLKAEGFDLNTGKYFQAGFGKVVAVKEMRQVTTEILSTLEIEIEMPQGMTYQTAANLNYFPENTDYNVARALLCVGLKEADLLKVSTHTQKAKMPCPPIITAGHLLRRFIDLQSMLKKSSIKHLAKFVSDAGVKAELQELLKKENADRLKEMNEKAWGIIDLIANYDINISIAQLLECTSRIVPRLYTIASSSKVNKNVVIVASMESKQVGAKLVGGLASLNFKSIEKRFKSGEDVQMRISIQDSTFILPKGTNTPSIYVATGTGYAPFRGFAEERQACLAKGQASVFGPATLFFGCCYRDQDYIYNDTIQQQQAEGVYNAVFEAFSREDPARKVYVQNIIEHKKDLFNRVFFEQGGNFYLCGSNRMSKAVIEIVQKFIEEIKGITEEEAKRMYQQLTKEHRICIESWAQLFD